MTAEDIMGQVDSWIASFLPQLQQWQAGNMTSYGSYLQLLRSHRPESTPADGALVIPDNLTGNPDYPWPPVPGVTDVPWPAALTVDEYQSGRGFGYLLRPQVPLPGRVWTRVEPLGPEAWLRLPWYDLMAAMEAM